jgi:parvulin-like peptidyl-prolyl isomerase
VVLGLLMGSGLTGAVRVGGAAEIIDGVAAIVNSNIITYSEVRQYVQPVVQQLRRSYSGEELLEQVRKAQMDALNSLIERALIIQEFNTKGYKIPDAVIDQQINDIIANDYGGNRATFVKTLEAENLTLSQYREQVRDRVIVQAMRGHRTQQAVIVSPYKIEKYYKDNLDQYKVGDQIKLRMIFIKRSKPEEVSSQDSQPGTNATVGPTNAVEQAATDKTEAVSSSGIPDTNNPSHAVSTGTLAETAVVLTNVAASAETNPAAAGAVATTNPPLIVTDVVAIEPGRPQLDLQRELAEEILSKLDAGESFESMARVYSEGREAREGGDWGWIGKDVLRKELNETAFSLKPGQHSRVIETAEGYYILQVDDVKPAHTIPLAEVRDDIEKTLLQQQRAKMQENWVKDLRAKAYIRLF